MADLQVKEIIKQMISYSNTEVVDDMPVSNIYSSILSQNT